MAHEKRVKQDQIIGHLKVQIENGESMKRIKQEEKSMENYIKNKEQYDKWREMQKLKEIRQKEYETKKVLDIQLAERKEQQRLRRYEDNLDCMAITKDIERGNSIEKAKVDAVK